VGAVPLPPLMRSNIQKKEKPELLTGKNRIGHFKKKVIYNKL